ncbi:hydantoinase subunit beta [Bacillus sp. FJAT-27264]|uniref:hydantoinase/oxoprolinase N-terminal domain-containing protein n=1 Tax=Paenibacillus sp. (strain DSM 101736 / FJAT-27264) TaxID=1850362 RepID=UPI0008080FF7|nr:hydantoinase/oxoprolinase family protein [Bacillus sp. FJAT-27264]OBZ11999.1 hydantoinase subunit beta [Bacillus sp. FJAT-27264]
MSYRIGIDVGGTHTDAVIMDKNRQLVSKIKVPTTEDIGSGIKRAIAGLLTQSELDPREIQFAMLGTTHCTNAIVERRNLAKIGVVRIGAPASLAIPPFLNWPKELLDKVFVGSHIISGGHEFDGRRIAPLDEAALREMASEWKGKVAAVAITSIFSPVDSGDEQRAQEIFQEILGDDIHYSLSSEIGSIGLIERENATILNAALVHVARLMVRGFEESLAENGIRGARIFLGQNDSTLMTSDYALRFPVLTIASGPTNSIRGAAYLTDAKGALVLDVGGTTTDIGVLVQGFPRESSLVAQIGGVRTNFRMPDLLSFGLGGGTRIRGEGDTLTVGPDSVGYLLPEKGLVFGGTDLTATDIAVAKGLTELGDRGKLGSLSSQLVESAYATMIDLVEEAIDKMKTTSDDIPAIVVGGGSIILPDQLTGVSEVIRPLHFEVANAIGVTIAEVSGQVEKIYSLEEWGRDQALEEAKRLAAGEAEAAGASADSVEIVDIEEVPLAYLPGNAVRIRVKAVGQLTI